LKSRKKGEAGKLPPFYFYIGVPTRIRTAVTGVKDHTEKPYSAILLILFIVSTAKNLSNYDQIHDQNDILLDKMLVLCLNARQIMNEYFVRIYTQNVLI